MTEDKNMGIIRTVLGDIDTRELGWCECRDHLFIDNALSSGDSAAPPTDEFDNYDNVVASLVSYKNAGGGAIIDGQTLGRGRRGSALVKAAQQTDVPIIASTGFNIQALYTTNFIFALEKVAIEKLFINELTFGMVGKNKEYLASYCAGIIKTGIDAGGIFKNAISEKLFSAAAKAASKTGAPVMVYVDTDASATDVLTFFTDHGVTADLLMFCHLDAVCNDTAVHEAILQTGAYISYDAGTAGSGIVQKMMSRGYTHRILIGAPSGNAAYDALLTTQDKLMQQLDIDSETLHAIMCQNPANALCIRK